MRNERGILRHNKRTLISARFVGCVALLLTGCKTVEPVAYCEPVTLYQDRYIPVDESLTQPVDVPELDENFDLIQLGATYKQTQVRLRQCNGRLAEIAEIK